MPVPKLAHKELAHNSDKQLVVMCAHAAVICDISTEIDHQFTQAAWFHSVS